MNDQKDLAQEFILGLEGTTEPLSEAGIADRCRAFRRQHEELADDARLVALTVAFSLSSGGGDDGPGPLDGYYRPSWRWKDDDGVEHAYPDTTHLTAENVAFWEKRVGNSSHPVMRARYADLVWVMKKRVTGENPDIAFARSAIDARLEMAKGNSHKYPTEVFRHLGRALTLALQTSDSARAGQVAEAIISFHGKVGDDKSVGLWIQPFDLLIARKGVALRDGLEEQIVEDLEERLRRVSRSDEPTSVNPFAAEAAAERLAAYYQRHNKQEDKRRVLKAYGAAFLTLATTAAPLVSCSWLQKVLQVYRDHGMREEAAAVSQRIHELEGRVHEDMKEVRVSVEIPREELEAHFEAMVTGQFGDVLHRIAGQYLPDPEQLAEELKRLDEMAPLQATFASRLIDHTGRTAAAVPALGGDFDARVAHHAHRDMLMRDLFLSEVIRRLRERFSFSAADLLAHLAQSPLFPESRRDVLLRGLQAFVDEDHVASLCVLVPEFEVAIRELLTLNGGLVYKPDRQIGGLMHRTLGDMLSDEAVGEALGERVSWYLRNLLCNPRGWNLRNDVCHGILSEKMYGAIATNRVFHALLVLGQVRMQETTEEDLAHVETTPSEETESHGDEG